MTLTLQKGGNLSLSKTDPSLTQLVVGLGWNPRTTDGAPFDLDASAFLLGANGQVRNGADFIFYNQLSSVDGAVSHTGDNRSGEGEGDDEILKVDLRLLAPEVDKVAFTVTIHEADVRGQSFGQVGGAYIRILNEATGAEVVRYDLAEDASTETAMIFAELYRHEGDWKFRAVGQGFQGGLKALAGQYGLAL